MTIDERTLCARLKSWIDAEIDAAGYGTITRAENEVHASGTNLRHDVLLYAGNRPVFSFEVKVPTSAQGATPYDTATVQNARTKALAEGLAYFGTLNCASFVLWPSDEPVTGPSMSLDRWSVVPPQDLSRLESAEAARSFREFVKRLLTLVASIDAGLPPSTVVRRPEDELVSRIEGSLDTIVGLTVPDVESLFSTDQDFRRDVKRWMIHDQHWQWDDQMRGELLLRTTKVSCYLQMNRILFYSTLRTRFPDLRELDVERARSGRGLKRRLEVRFREAMEVSLDYETVFDVGYITEVAYAGDAATAAWGALVQSVQGIDLAGVGLDVLGGIFERLLSPEERHRFGQHYTNPELVDLLVASSLKSSTQTVLDPASGGGTFLVRAYERLRHLGEPDHLILLQQVYGNDLSRFAGHLSTVNLAIRQIAREENYPRVGTHDFFALEPGGELVALPVSGSDPPERHGVALPLTIDAVVGNPPYIRRQGIDAAQKRRAEDAVARYGVEHGRPAFALDGLSDFHVYFWPHATRFLGPGGYLSFLTSSSWLHTRYGQRLKQLLSQGFDIEFMAETEVEPWFSDARVRTVATVARKRAPGVEVDPDHLVRFVQFRKPLEELLGPAHHPGRWGRVDSLLSDMRVEGADERIRVRSVRQVDLEPEDDWSIWLRAPDLYHDFIDLPNVANVCSAVADDSDPYILTVGPKHGSKWFTVRPVEDVSDEKLASWGIRRGHISASNARYTVVAGEGWEGPIESRYLARWVRGPGDEETRRLGPSSGDLVVTVPRNSRIRSGAKIWSYIRHGEEQGEHRRTYTGSRGTMWYSIEEMETGPIIFPYSMQYGHKVWENPRSAVRTTSPNAYLTPRGASTPAALALLNSTWTFLAALFDAGAVGTEGLVRFGGRGSWKRLHVIDPRAATEDQLRELEGIWDEIRAKVVHPFPPEGDEPLGGVRRRLDELALLVAGVQDRVDASEMVDSLYRWLQENTGQRANVEEQAVAGRHLGSSSARLRAVVDQATSELDVVPPWIDRIDATWTVISVPDGAPDTSPQASLLGMDDEAERPTDVRVGDQWLRFDTESQAAFVLRLLDQRMAPRRLAIPPGLMADECLENLEGFLTRTRRELRGALDERLSEESPRYGEAFVQGMTQVVAKVRTSLHEANHRAS